MEVVHPRTCLGGILGSGRFIDRRGDDEDRKVMKRRKKLSRKFRSQPELKSDRLGEYVFGTLPTYGGTEEWLPWKILGSVFVGVATVEG